MFSRQKTNQKILRTAHSVSFLDVDITASESKPNYPVASLKKPSHTWFPMLCIATTLQSCEKLRKVDDLFDPCGCLFQNMAHLFHADF